MRVLQLISPTGFYGAERWILALARHLGEHDVGCDLAVTSEDPGQPIELFDRFPLTGGERHRVELAHRFDLQAIDAVRQIVTSRRIDVVHSHGYKSDLLGWRAARGARVICISTPHGFGQSTDLKLRLFIRAGAVGLRFLDKVVPLSKQLVGEVAAFGVPAEKIELIANGVDVVEIDESVPDYQAEFTRPGRRVGFIGRLVPGKRVHELLEVFDALWRNDPSRTLDIAGDGSERAVLEGQANSLACADAIRFHGYVENRFSLMSELDLFVMTSEREGIPRCLMEALALGLPAAAYDIDGVRELVLHEQTGLLAPLGDVSALTGICERLLSARTEAARLALAGRARVRTHFSAERMARDYVALYRALAVRR